LTLKVVSQSRVTWTTSVPILYLPRPLYSRLVPDVRDRQTSSDVRQKHNKQPWRSGLLFGPGTTLYTQDGRQ